MSTSLPKSSRPSGSVGSPREALRGGALEEAEAGFRASIASAQSPEAYEGLAEATWRLGDSDAAVAALESAYELYHARGDRASAARVATALALRSEILLGKSAVASGWLQRARWNLEGLEPSPEHAWLAVWEGHFALLFHQDFATAARKIDEARGLAARLGLHDVELLSLGLEGVALVSRCEVEEGMRRLDEVTAAAIGGEIAGEDAAGNATCYLLTACERVQDFDRAGQWLEKVRERLTRVRFVPGRMFCRDHLVGILIWRGAWDEAEREIDAMIREAEVIAPRFVATGFLRRGVLRHRQGRPQEAAEALEQAGSHPGTFLVRAAMALDEGDAEGAASNVRRFFRSLPSQERLDRAPGLEILARAEALRARERECRAALEELRSIADAVPTEGLRAALRVAEGVVLRETGDAEGARAPLEDAVDLYERSGSAFESARARLELARTLLSLGRREDAAREARAALAVFARLGAAGGAARATGLLEPLQGSRAGEKGRPVAGLTARETEVLRLVADGLSNASIGEALCLSGHTVKRHVANILGKLDLPSRAAAAAYFVGQSSR